MSACTRVTVILSPPGGSMTKIPGVRRINKITTYINITKLQIYFFLSARVFWFIHINFYVMYEILKSLNYLLPH